MCCVLRCVLEKIETFSQGGLDLGGAPSSVASSREHLDFLQLFCRQLRDQLQEQEQKQELKQGAGEEQAEVERVR